MHVSPWGMLIDSHCHLAKFARAGTLDETLARAAAAGVERCITVGTSLEDWELYHRLAAERPGQVDFTVGLHPTSAEDDWEDQLKALPTFFGTDPQPVALGEIGLDHFHLPKYPDEAAEVKARQVRAFRAQLSIAYQFDCPVVIHSRGAFHETVALIEESGVDWRKVVFHCFAEGPGEMRILNEKGARGSFTGIVTYANKSADPVRAALRAQGLERLMVETDCPYLTPVPKRGEPNEPAYVAHTAAACAEQLGVAPVVLAEHATANTAAFFGLKG
ncbi:MAG: TatD family hydrolase [Verrucomicrobiota bacterium]